MLIKNTKTHFGLIAIVFHWIMTLIVIGMLTVGFYMVDLPADPEKAQLYSLHKATGALVLILVILRILWRWTNIRPVLLLPALERITARITHWLLYLLMVAMPLSGWLMSSSAGYPVSFYGLFTLPDLVSPNPDVSFWSRQVHGYMAYVLVALIILHTLGALKHHFIDKDDILKRMIS